MKKKEKFDNLFVESYPTFFYFVEPGEDLYSAYRCPLPYGNVSFDTLLKKVRANDLNDLPSGTYAVIIYYLRLNEFVYFKTIKHRRKNFALSCDSE